LKNIIMCTPSSRSPARPFRYYFSMMDSLRVLSPTIQILYCGFGDEEGTYGSELAAGVGASGGHPGSNARAWRSLAIDQLCESRVTLGGEERTYGGRKIVAAGGATRYGGGGPHDRPP
jgi:hypothetical protein